MEASWRQRLPSAPSYCRPMSLGVPIPHWLLHLVA